MDIKTTVTVYLDGRQSGIAQPGFYERLRELLTEFGATTASTSVIAINEDMF